MHLSSADFFFKIDFLKKILEHLSAKNIRSRCFVGPALGRNSRVATVREKVLENEKFSRSGKSQGITFSVREI